MSAPTQDPHHGHDHKDPQGHDHDHDHDHPHDHDHAHTSAPAQPASAGMEDAATQALSEALGSSFKIIRVLLGGLVVVFLLSGMFTVEPNELAVKLRFGRPVGLGNEQLLKPGWHWAFPYPLEEVVKIPVGQSHSITTTNGWYATTPEMEARNERPPAKWSLTPGVDGYTLTGDGNIIHVRTHLKFRIADPLLYAFRFVKATNLLEHAIDNAMFYASAKFTAESALYHEKPRFQEAVLEKLQKTLALMQLGIAIETGDVQTSAPLEVLPKFEEVLTAQQEGDTKVREAEGYSRSALNRAGGDAAVIRNFGLNSSNQLFQTVAAEAKYFSDQLPYFESNPELFRQRWLLETRARVFTNAQEKHFISARADGKPRELRLLLSREPQKPAVKEQP